MVSGTGMYLSFVERLSFTRELFSTHVTCHLFVRTFIHSPSLRRDTRTYDHSLLDPPTFRVVRSSTFLSPRIVKGTEL